MLRKTLVLVGAVLCASAAGAQTPPPAPVPEPKLNFDREVFHYPGDGRKDPFRPLVGTDAGGPLFEDLTLRGIVLSGDPKKSIATITDGSKKVYRVRVGDVIGNSRVAGIERAQVRMIVMSYGQPRQEVMKLATRMTPAQMQALQTPPQQAGDAFQQELLRALMGQRGQPQPARTDTVRPPVRRDTISPARRPNDERQPEFER